MAPSLPPENTASWDFSSSEIQFKYRLFQAASLDHSSSRWSAGRSIEMSTTSGFKFEARIWPALALGTIHP